MAISLLQGLQINMVSPIFYAIILLYCHPSTFSSLPYWITNKHIKILFIHRPLFLSVQRNFIYVLRIRKYVSEYFKCRFLTLGFIIKNSMKLIYMLHLQLQLTSSDIIVASPLESEYFPSYLIKLNISTKHPCSFSLLTNSALLLIGWFVT